MSFSTATSKPTLPPHQLIVSQFVVGNFEKQLLLGHENPHARSRSSTNLLLNIPATTRSRQPSSANQTILTSKSSHAIRSTPTTTTTTKNHNQTASPNSNSIRKQWHHCQTKHFGPMVYTPTIPICCGESRRQQKKLNVNSFIESYPSDSLIELFSFFWLKIAIQEICSQQMLDIGFY